MATMDAYQIETLQTHIIFAMFCSAVISSLQPHVKFSSVQFYDNAYFSVMLWNLVGTAYMLVRVIELFKGRGISRWFIPMKISETLLWILPVFFVGYEGGLLAKKYVVGSIGLISVSGAK